MFGQVHIRSISDADLPQIERLHAETFGPGRFARTAYRIREGTSAVSPICLAAWQSDALVGAVQVTEVTIGAKPNSLLLGPLVIRPALKGQGIGLRLLNECVKRARSMSYRLIILVGDLDYYARAGFTQTEPGQFIMPGPVDPARLLAIELRQGALSSTSGLVSS